MKQLLVIVVVALNLIGPARAQAPSGAAWAVPAYQGYPFPGLPPSDAYRQGLINRWELERLEGPTPQALQGPSPNGGNAAPGSSGM